MKIKYLLLLSVFFSSATFAQLSTKWTAELKDMLSWQKVTTSGNYLVSTTNSLYSFDQESGDLLWQNNELVGYGEMDINELQGSPLLIAQKGGNVNIFSPFDGKIKFNSQSQGVTELVNKTFLYKANGILIAGKNSSSEPVLMMVDVTDGKVLWSINEKFGRLVSINELSENEIIITTLFNVYKINSKTGAIIWKNSVSAGSEGLENSALGALFKDMAEEMSKGMEFVIRYYQNVEKDVFVIASEIKNETQTSDGKTVVNYKNNYVTFKLSDGSRIWNNPFELKGKLGDLAFYQNGIIILPDDGNRTIINYVELNSAGEGSWGKKGKGIVMKGGIYNHVVTDKGILLMSRSGSTNFLNLLNASTGELVYDKPLKISGEVLRTIDSKAGLVYITTEEANILNTTTGSPLLSKSINTNSALTHLEGSVLYAFDQKSNTLASVDINTLEFKNITTDKLKFEGKESPTSIEYRANGILIASEQNLALFTHSGELVYQKYYPAPRESGLKRALLIAQAVRASYIAANSYAAAGMIKQVTPAAKENNAVEGAIVEGIGMAYEELGSQASDFAKKSFSQAQERFKATSQSRDFLIIFSEIDKENNLIKVNKNTGEIEAKINLGKEKEPKYAMDDVTGKVFTLSGTKMINCFDIN